MKSDTLKKLNEVAEYDEDAMRRWEERVRYNEFHKVKLEDLGFKENRVDHMYYLKINKEVEITFVPTNNTVHLDNDATGDYFGLGRVVEFDQLKILVLILKLTIKQ